MPSEKKSSKKKSQQNSSYSTTFELFAGSYVNIYIKNIKAGITKGKIANLSFAGYLLDEDDNYYFIGQTTNEVFAAIKKDEVAAIILSDQIEELMGEISVPENQEVQ